MEVTLVSLRLGEELAGRAASERQTIHATDSDPDLSSIPALMAESIRCYYGVPLVAKGQIKGVLEVFHRGLIRPCGSIG